ncbi:MAG TPA: hypothetical protein VF038_09840 [Usitatibacter sp.]|jgi:hypothetical protein
MKQSTAERRLARENERYLGAGARSEENFDFGFRPAFFDYASQKLYLSCFASGQSAPIHLLEGLPEEVIVDRAPDGRILSTRASLVAGFERNGAFYTRKAAARALAALRSRRWPRRAERADAPRA